MGAVQVRGRDVPDEVADGADRVEDRRLGIDDLLPEAAGGEALGVGDPPAGHQRRVTREHLGVGVEQRQAAEEGVLRERLHRLSGRGRDDLQQAAGREVVGGVLLDDALGAAGGARGEHDPGVVGPGVAEARGLTVAGRHEGGQGLVGKARVRALALARLPHDHVLEARQLALDQVEAVQELVRDDQLLGLDQVDRPRQEVALVGGVDRAHHGAGLQDPEPDRDEVLAVGEHHADRLARLHATGDQGVGDPVGARVDLAVAHPRRVGELQVVAVGVLRRPPLEDLCQDPGAWDPHAHTSRSTRPFVRTSTHDLHSVRNEPREMKDVKHHLNAVAPYQ